MTESAKAARPERGDDYATWDAPYVLGALDRAERLEYEAHLQTCSTCRAAVADLAVLPGLLGRVDTDVALALTDPTDPPDFAAAAPIPLLEPPADLLAPPTTSSPQPATSSPRRAFGRGPWPVVAAAAAAAAAAVLIAVPATIAVTEHRAPTVAEQVVAEREMTPVTATPVAASVKVLDVGGKATIEMSCRYVGGDQGYQSEYELWMTDTDGVPTRLIGWPVAPGGALTLSSTTNTAPDRIRSLEIKSPDGRTLLTGAI
ncbi:zf-HC2 domain-containing protein [Nocardia terpenica]|uniref:anti-sigma factor family protein n=1 Tax=Nocardia terpenica TaxID=455432 RepID=UPI001895F641|nr:zf-HC2 domain-containing protein [Nocardia terpenica]MBF6062899.1 zf-HC2 domain-containing protein [Nocardia terpenica]MBF6104966.1 zf-HC2 domain-containing protein [Nocardia terpenica]MBF6112597.1 zf-HC2 domain-containing protein [Nocardia terpenica]MBF6118694.1 zf-HC2 domain-containing protein [Nocardia terpenica]MBF6154163.1 zf-HC2 domain-containing protein [Nocardia terpenica]